MILMKLERIKKKDSMTSISVFKWKCICNLELNFGLNIFIQSINFTSKQHEYKPLYIYNRYIIHLNNYIAKQLYVELCRINSGYVDNKFIANLIVSFLRFRVTCVWVCMLWACP